MQPRSEARTFAQITINELQLRVDALDAMTVSQLREEFERVFDEPTASRNKRYLVKWIAYRMQELVHGGLSERARKRIEELARNAPIRRQLRLLVPPVKDLPTTLAEPSPQRPVPKPVDAPASAPPPRSPRDPRLPQAGAIVRKLFHEVEYEIRVNESDFEYLGKRCQSLSGVARATTRTGWNGFLCFERELAQAKGGEP